MYTQRIAETDPAAAVQWVQTISDTDMRNSRLESLLGSWLKADANAATAWIGASALPEETKMRLLPKLSLRYAAMESKYFIALSSQATNHENPSVREILRFAQDDSANNERC